MNYTVIRHLISSLWQINQKAQCECPTDDWQSVREQCPESAATHHYCQDVGHGRQTFKLLLLWNNFPETESNTCSFIPGQNGDSEALCPLECYRNVFRRERQYRFPPNLNLLTLHCLNTWVLCPWGKRWHKALMLVFVFFLKQFFYVYK